MALEGVSPVLVYIRPSLGVGDTRNLHRWQRNLIPKPKKVNLNSYALVFVIYFFILRHWSIGLKIWISQNAEREEKYTESHIIRHIT